MKRVMTISALIVLAIVLFVCAVKIDVRTRRARAAPMTIAGVPITGVEISGEHMPDFLWQGRAWWIEIDTDRPLLLTLDEWTGRIPVGIHRVYSNHDHTNTHDYGDTQFWGFPKTVSVQEATP